MNMARLYLVRHGQAAATWTQDRDPPLDAEGEAQALRVADALAAQVMLPIATSPLRRCRQTAAPLAARAGKSATIVEAVREVPSPIGDLALRGRWLRGLMDGTWSQAMRDDGAVLGPWMRQLQETWRFGFAQDTVVFSHFIAINVAVGMATDSDRVINFRPANTSITTIDVTHGRLALVGLGAEGETRVTSG